MNQTFFVSLDAHRALAAIEQAVVGGSITGERIDAYTIDSHCGSCHVRVYEKHYYRAGNRLTLTVVVDSFAGRTRVHYASGGGGEGLLRFDWGAANSFARIVPDTLSAYRIL